MKLNDKFIFFFSKITTLEIRTKIVYPSESATLAASKQSCGFGERTPATFAMDANIVDETLVFFFGPSAFVGVCLFTARGASHIESKMEGF